MLAQPRITPAGGRSQADFVIGGSDRVRLPLGLVLAKVDIELRPASIGTSPQRGPPSQIEHPTVATISKVQVRGFVSLKNVAIDLPPLLALVGKNDTGKTNLLKAIRLVGSLASQNLEDALDPYG